MADSLQQQLLNAQRDVADLATVVNGPADPGTVVTRLGTVVRTVTSLLALVVAQPPDGWLQAFAAGNSPLRGSTGADGLAGGNPDARVVYPRQLPGAKFNADIKNGGGDDDTAVIQAILDTPRPDNTPLRLVFTGVARVSQLRVPSNTHLDFLPGAGLFQAADFPGPMLRNANPVRGQFGDTEQQQYDRIVDHNIKITGGSFNGNIANSTATGIRGTNNELLNIMSFYGVRDLVLKPRRLFNSRCYFVHLALCESFDVGEFYFNQPMQAAGNGLNTGPTGYNGDGIHLNGPCRYFDLHDCTGRAADDFVALTASDGGETGDQGMFANTTFAGPYVGEGPIHDGTANRMRLLGSLYGFRALTKRPDRSPIYNIAVNDWTGTTYGRFLAIDSYPESGNPYNGWIDNCSFSRWKVGVIRHVGGDNASAGTPYPQTAIVSRSVNIGCSFGTLRFDGWNKVPTQLAAETHYQWFDFDGNANGDLIEFSRMAVRNRNGEDLRGEGIVRGKQGALVRSFVIDGWDWQRDYQVQGAADVPATGHIMDWQGGAIGVFRVANLRANRCESPFKLRGNGSYSVFQATNCYLENISTSSIDETQYLNPQAPRAPGGLLYLNAGLNPIVTMQGCVGAPALVGPTALSATTANIDDERVGVAIDGSGNITRCFEKSDSIASVTRLGVGIYSVNHKVPISLSGIVATSYTLGHLTQSEFTSATQSKVYVVDPNKNPVDPSTLSVVLQRGGYVSV